MILWKHALLKDQKFIYIEKKHDTWKLFLPSVYSANFMKIFGEMFG
jgi:hypothetical protein